MRNTWTHLMVSDTFYFIVDDIVFCPKDDKPYCPLTYGVPGHTPLSSKGKIQYPHYPHIPQQSYTAKPSGTAAQFHSTFRSGNPDNPTSIASHITV